jgi:hypothetical protein
VSQFASEEEFEQWFVDRYGHHSRDWHDDRGLPYPGDEPLQSVVTEPAPSSRRREAIQALIDRGATEGERSAAQAAMYRLDHPSTLAHDATERGSYYARDTLAHGGDE